MKRLLFLFLILGFSSTISAQTIKEVFISALFPELLPLSATDRLDLFDLYEGGKEAVVKNVFGDEVSLNQLADDYLKIQSGNSTTELFLLTMINESYLIGSIQTVCAPLCDSRLEFYSVNWKKLDLKTFISPAGQSWFIRENADSSALDIPFMEFHYDPEKQILSQTYRPLSSLNEEDTTVEKNIREYKWNGIRFE